MQFNVTVDNSAWIKIQIEHRYQIWSNLELLL